MNNQTTYRLIMFTLGIIFIVIMVMSVIKEESAYPLNGYMQESDKTWGEIK